MAGFCQGQRHPACAGAHIKDAGRVAVDRRGVRELPPKRQVGAVATALQVVPHDLGRPHHHALRASPRATSSSRSDSIAV